MYWYSRFVLYREVFFIRSVLYRSFHCSYSIIGRSQDIVVVSYQFFSLSCENEVLNYCRHFTAEPLDSGLQGGQIMIDNLSRLTIW